MRPEDLLATPALLEELAREDARLPEPPPERAEAVHRLLETSRRAPPETEWPPLLETPRGKKDSRYAEAPTSHRTGGVGPLLVLSKRAFRLVFQPFINEVLRKQVEFNEAILDSLALLYEHQREESRAQALWRRELQERLTRLEQQARSEPDPASQRREEE